MRSNKKISIHSSFLFVLIFYGLIIITNSEVNLNNNPDIFFPDNDFSQSFDKLDPKFFQKSAKKEVKLINGRVPSGYCKKKDGLPGKECTYSYYCATKYCSGDLHTACETSRDCLHSAVCGTRDKKCCMPLDWACSDASDCCQNGGNQRVHCKPMYVLKGTTYEMANTYCKTATKLIGESCKKDSECLDRADSSPHCKNGKCCLGQKATCQKNEECCNGLCTSLGGIKFNQRECCPSHKVGIGKSCEKDDDCCTGNCNNKVCHLGGCHKDGAECHPMIDDRLSPNEIRNKLKEYEAEIRAGRRVVQKGDKLIKLEYSTLFSLKSVCCEGSYCDSTEPMIPGHYAGRAGKCVPIVRN